MPAPTAKPETPIKSLASPGAESPTTAQPLDMDDDEAQEPSASASDSGQPKPATIEAEAPPKPPRPVSATQQAETTLKEAFPTIDAAVIRAVLTASGGRVEPAFNALLGMSDPDAAREAIPPPQPPRPNAHRFGSTPQSQLDADEQYARQIAEQYGGYETRGSYRGGSRQNEPEERNFIDDDLPVIKENLRKGFVETQNRVNGWITNLRKRIDGEDVESSPAQGYNAGVQAGGGRPRRSGDGRPSGDYNRYDADPQVLGDVFGGIQLNENSDSVPRRPARPLANPDLFKPTPATPTASDGRKVVFQDNPSQNTDLYKTSPKVAPREHTPTSGKQSKWQPLSAIDPSPIGDTEPDHDPFSLGDSEDEKEAKSRVGGKEVRTGDAERLKAAAAEAMADTIGEPARKPEPAETSGTKNKIAEELASGKS